MAARSTTAGTPVKSCFPQLIYLYDMSEITYLQNDTSRFKLNLGLVGVGFG